MVARRGTLSPRTDHCPQGALPPAPPPGSNGTLDRGIFGATKLKTVQGRFGPGG